MSRKTIHFAFLLALILVFFWLFMGYLLPIGLPFLLGLVLARAAEPATGLLQGRFSLPRGGAVAISVSGVCLLTATVLFLLVSVLGRQLQQLADLLPRLESALQQITQQLQDWLQGFSQRLPGTLGELAAGWTENLFSSSGTMMQQAILQLPRLATGLLSGLSKGMLGLVTGLISAYMIAGRLPALRAWWQAHQPQRWQEKWLPALRQLKKGLGGWLWAEMKLAGVAFVILLAGFLVLRIRNALLWAALVTLVDAFPILGVGTVLLPWAAVCFLQGEAARGIGLTTVYGVVWLTRSVLEPKFLGKSLGLDPLVTLVAIYAGLKLWGIAGLLLAPILALTATQILKQVR